MQTVVVVGASLAGLRATEALRRDGFDGRIVLVGAEPHLPYDRPPLSKQLLAGEWEAQELVLRRAPYDELELDLRLGVRATSTSAWWGMASRPRSEKARSTFTSSAS